MSKTQYGQNMKLITSYWSKADTFKLMPINDDCPYSEVIYDPRSTLLVVVSKSGKPQYTMVEKLDDDGELVKAKRPKANGKPWKEQRVMMDTLTEHYIPVKEEQEEFIKEFAVNADTFDYSKFLRDMDAEPTIVGAGGVADLKKGITDEHGTPITSN